MEDTSLGEVMAKSGMHLNYAFPWFCYKHSPSHGLAEGSIIARYHSIGPNSFQTSDGIWSGLVIIDDIVSCVYLIHRKCLLNRESRLGEKFHFFECH